MTTMQRIASNITEARKRKGLTIEVLATKTGITRQYIGRIERADTSITIDTLEKIANALEISNVELLKENHED
jgi:transcriptional regulator with XRE-family HTH domain